MICGVTRRYLSTFKSSSRNSTTTTNNKTCWSCGRVFTESESRAFFCPCERKTIQPVNPSLTYFDLFNLRPVRYRLNPVDLTKNFRQLMRKLHPDLFTQKSETEKKLSSDQASLVNNAYRTLSSPIGRGLYLLELAGVEFERETVDTSSDELDTAKTRILMEILELNEKIDEISTANQVEGLEIELSEIMRPFESELEKAFERGELKRCVDILSKMKYYRNVDERLKELKFKYKLLEDS